MSQPSLALAARRLGHGQHLDERELHRGLGKSHHARSDTLEGPVLRLVNEPLNDDGTMQNNTFYQILGKEYIKIAFETAAKADPHAKLYINDFNIEGITNLSLA